MSPSLRDDVENGGTDEDTRGPLDFIQGSPKPDQQYDEAQIASAAVEPVYPESEETNATNLDDPTILIPTPTDNIRETTDTGARDSADDSQMTEVTDVEESVGQSQETNATGLDDRAILILTPTHDWRETAGIDTQDSADDPQETQFTDVEESVGQYRETSDAEVNQVVDTSEEPTSIGTNVVDIEQDATHEPGSPETTITEAPLKDDSASMNDSEVYVEGQDMSMTEASIVQTETAGADLQAPPVTVEQSSLVEAALELGEDESLSMEGIEEHIVGHNDIAMSDTSNEYREVASVVHLMLPAVGVPHIEITGPQPMQIETPSMEGIEEHVPDLDVGMMDSSDTQAETIYITPQATEEAPNAAQTYQGSQFAPMDGIEEHSRDATEEHDVGMTDAPGAPAEPTPDLPQDVNLGEAPTTSHQAPSMDSTEEAVDNRGDATAAGDATKPDRKENPQKRKASDASQEGPGPSVKKPKGRMPKPVAGPDERLIFKLIGDRICGYELIRCPDGAADPSGGEDAAGRTTAHKRKWEGPQDDDHGLEGYCTAETLLRAFRYFESVLHNGAIAGDIIQAIGEIIPDGPKRMEWEAYKIGFNFSAPAKDWSVVSGPVPIQVRTYVGRGQWVPSEVTTFERFLQHRGIRPSGRGPWSVTDAVQVIMEYLVHRIPFLVTTCRILVLLEQRLTPFVGIAAATTGGEVQQNDQHRQSGTSRHRPATAAVLPDPGRPERRLYSRSYAAPLYEHIRERLFWWAARLAPARTRGGGGADLRRLRVWANEVAALCGRNKAGRTHDVWEARGGAGDGPVIARWAAADVAAPDALRGWFGNWLDHVVGRKLCESWLCPDEGTWRGYLEGLRHQMDAEITGWLQDFDGWGADRAGPSAQAQAIAAIIAANSGERR